MHASIACIEINNFDVPNHNNLVPGTGCLFVGLNLEGVKLSTHAEPSKPQLSQLLSTEMAFNDAVECFENTHLVIFVDEAQNTHISSAAQVVVNSLHQGIQGISLITALFGLSDTKQVLRQCGLSRFHRDRVVRLDTLSYEEAVSAIQDIF